MSKEQKQLEAIKALGALQYLIEMYVPNFQIKFRMQRQLKFLEAFLMGRI